MMNANWLKYASFLMEDMGKIRAHICYIFRMFLAMLLGGRVLERDEQFPAR